MAVYNLEEQEQIDALKAWWNQYGRTVIAAVVLGIAVFAAIQFYYHLQRQKQIEAAALYGSFQKYVEEKNKDKSLAAAQDLAQRYSNSGYAARAALLAAKVSFEAGDSDNAQKQLRWAVDNSKEGDIQALARVRLAGLLADRKKFSDALAMLDGINVASFAALAADLRGDILLAQGRSDEARAAYKLALEKAGDQSGLRNLTQMKLDALGGAK